MLYLALIPFTLLKRMLEELQEVLATSSVGHHQVLARDRDKDSHGHAIEFLASTKLVFNEHIRCAGLSCINARVGAVMYQCKKNNCQLAKEPLHVRIVYAVFVAKKCILIFFIKLCPQKMPQCKKIT